MRPVFPRKAVTRSVLRGNFGSDSPCLDSDAVSGAKRRLIRAYERQPAGSAPDGTRLDAPWRRLRYGSGLKPA